MWMWNRLRQKVSLMHNGVRLGKLAFHGTMLMLLWSVVPLILPSAYSQPQEPVPVEPVVPPPQPKEPVPVEPAKKQGEPTIEHKRVRPSETYIAGFGGSTFGGKLSNLEGPLGGNLGGNLSDRDLADAGVYGGKLGHFFGDRMNWLGVEMEAFNTTPHVEQQGPLPGRHFRVTTLAFNLIGRLKFGCETKTERTETRTEREIRYETR